MAIPSGSGTEVLKRATIHNNNNATTEILSGVANHIYTILTIVICENQGATENISITMNDGSNDIDMIYDVSLPAKASYVWNDRVVLSGTDQLKIRSHGTSGLDVIVSYIDQDWT